MTKPLYLYQGQRIKGQFVQKKLNLVLMFQVNCPGCFLYALPVFNQLYKHFKDDIGMLALSTAFEDFELNTEQNTIDLVESGTLIGHTKQALLSHGYDKLQIVSEFPISMDKKMEASQLEEVTSAICQLHPQYTILNNADQKKAYLNVKSYLQKIPEVSLTFTSNQFRGTPTFILFNDKNELLHSWFGHIKKNVVIDTINELL